MPKCRFFEIIVTFKLITLFFSLCFMFFDLLNWFSISSKSKSGPQAKKNQHLAILWPFFALKYRFFEIIVTFKLKTLFFRLYYMFFDLLNWLSISSKSKSGPQTKKNQNLAIFRDKIPFFEIIVTCKLIPLLFRLYFMFFDLLNWFSISLKSKSDPQKNIALLI